MSDDSYTLVTICMYTAKPCNRRAKVSTASLVCAAVVALAWVTPLPALAVVEANVTHVGFPVFPGGHAVRNGNWIPVTIDLSLVDQTTFDGSARVSQLDGDGDACFDSVEIHLRQDNSGAQRVQLFVPARPIRSEMKLFVEFFDVEGEATQVLSQGLLDYRASPTESPIIISDDDVLIMSIGNSTAGRVQNLMDSDTREKLRRQVHVGHISPADVPELWHGLESVDYIVWDAAKPEDMTQRQLEAIIEWVNQGGVLFLTASRTAGSITLSPKLYELLPVELGETVVVDNLWDVREKLLGKPKTEARFDTGDLWLQNAFPSSVPIVKGELRDGATRIAFESPVNTEIVSRRKVGRGHVIFSGITLRDLFSGDGESTDLFTKLFHLHPIEDADRGRPHAVSIYDKISGAVSFPTFSSAYLLLAGVFTLTYVFIATFGSWIFLTRKGWRRYSWTMFSITAIACSVLSVVVVNWMRGFGETVHQLSIIDVEAGSQRAHATVLIGLKTSQDKRLDVWLPSDPLGATKPGPSTCWIKPLPSRNDIASGVTSFADPGTYRILPGSAEIQNVRIRGTLKQFEGRWDGVLDGTVSGSIVINNRLISEDSFIVNNLGVLLTDCLLIHSTIDFGDTDSINETNQLRDQSTFTYNIGELPSDGSRIMLYDLCYGQSPGETAIQLREKSKLGHAHDQWAANFKGVLQSIGLGPSTDERYARGQEQQALLLSSTVGEFSAKDAGTLGFGGSSSFYAISRDRLRQLDLTESLIAGAPAMPATIDVENGQPIAAKPKRPGYVMLVGFAKEAGPIRLFSKQGDHDFRPIEPDSRYASTMYRFQIPVSHASSGAIEKSPEPQ